MPGMVNPTVGEAVNAACPDHASGDPRKEVERDLAGRGHGVAECAGASSRREVALSERVGGGQHTAVEQLFESERAERGVVCQ
jgi:hypothetical protein